MHGTEKISTTIKNTISKVLLKVFLQCQEKSMDRVESGIKRERFILYYLQVCVYVYVCVRVKIMCTALFLGILCFTLYLTNSQHNKDN